MRFGHRVRGIIERYDQKGRGVLEVPETKPTVGHGTFAVPFTAVGDEVTARFVSRDRGMKIATLEHIETPSPDRVSTPCPHAGVCGGCLWQHLAYEAQIKIKHGMIDAAFANAGHDERIGTFIQAAEKFHYRNRMDYAVGWNGQIGLKEYGSWSRYVDLSTCLLLNDGVGEILQHVRDWMRDADLQPYDAKFYTGDVRYVVIREAKHTDQRLITLVVKDASRVSEAHRSALEVILSPYCTSLLLGEQSLKTDLSHAQRFDILKGEPWFEEVANGVTYRIHPNSFFQTNTTMAEELQRVVKDYVGAPKTLLDLYCGLGFFGIYLAKQDPSLHVSGYEIDAEAIALATRNANANGVADRCVFTSGPAEDLSWKDIDADCVILDPPRAGLHPKVLKTVIEKRPETIVYVSCNYHRLVEELKEFKEHYTIEDVGALDLFPHTRHVEVVVRMVKKDL